MVLEDRLRAALRAGDRDQVEVLRAVARRRFAGMFGLPPSLMEDTYDDDLIGVAGPVGRSALRRRH